MSRKVNPLCIQCSVVSFIVHNWNIAKSSTLTLYLIRKYKKGLRQCAKLQDLGQILLRRLCTKSYFVGFAQYYELVHTHILWIYELINKLYTFDLEFWSPLLLFKISLLGDMFSICSTNISACPLFFLVSVTTWTRT